MYHNAKAIQPTTATIAGMVARKIRALPMRDAAQRPAPTPTNAATQAMRPQIGGTQSECAKGKANTTAAREKSPKCQTIRETSASETGGMFRLLGSGITSD